MKLNINPVKTYKTEENAVKAAEKLEATKSNRYFVMKSEDNRFFPVFIGESAIRDGIHFHFNVIG